MKNYWLLADPHFLHDREILKRPTEYEEKLFKNMLTIPEKDILVVLGDICVGKDLEAHKKFIIPLKCKKILVRGNHDGKSNTWYLEHGWDFVCEAFSLKMYGKRILFTHIPDLYDLEKFDVNIHGHLHNNAHRGSPEECIFHDRHLILISSEFNNYHPVTLKSLL